MKQRSISGGRYMAASFLVVLLCGCTRYHPKPLPTAPDLTATPQLTVPARSFWLPGLAPHPIPSEGLDEITVQMLAVFNNPGLKAARLQAGVASAQLLQAGLLPDPQFGAGFATSALNYGGELGLNEDIQALITRGAARAAAAASSKQVNLNILWQEWQIAESARELFIQARWDDELLAVLSANEHLLADRVQRDQAAMQRGDQTSTAVSVDLVAQTDAQTSLRLLQTDTSANRHQLNELLGLQPDVQLHLIGRVTPTSISRATFDASLADLPRHRVDLLALQAGYQSQEENVRRSILAQFPSMSAGVLLERDPVEGVNAFGPQVSITLPVFDRNRGHIAIERATREALHQAYQAQLDAADAQAHQVWDAILILSAQVRDLDQQLPALKQTASAADQSKRQGNLDAGVYTVLETDLLAKEAESIRLHASLDRAQSALNMLLGLPFQAP
jgi:cobalt-zinc-cadmium efflux system outer membrane protein